jgi:Mn2+/Fe2+ NRAMP family transporter
MSPQPPKDLYAFDPADIENPPRSWGGALRRIGPGMILSASIVGSGELIATTTLGAQVGYVALWVILLSCLIKPAVQAAIGRFTVATGETGLAGFNMLPGPKAGVRWTVWMWAAMVLMTQFQVGAMYAGVAQVLHLLVPSVHMNAWVALLVGITLALLLGGGYARVEKLATIKVGLFTMLTMLCAMLLMRRPEFFSWHQLSEGLSFRLPGDGLITAVAVFGMTGVGATEIFMYPYWCIEKGYARFTGPNDASEGWRSRALGWIRVMHFDIIATMVIYTVATVAFYLLGAGVLHGMGLMPAATDMMPVLSRMYTEMLGPWALWFFYIGGIATLYGTVFAGVAAHSRIFSDMCRLLGFFAADDYAARVKFRQWFVVALSIFPALLYLLFQSPVRMVVAGGVAQAITLPVIAAGALYLRHRKLPKELAPGRLSTVWLWFAALVVICLMAYYTVASLR